MKMKKIVITGAMGYIGSELCKIYSGLTNQYEVIAIELASSSIAQSTTSSTLLS